MPGSRLLTFSLCGILLLGVAACSADGQADGDDGGEVATVAPEATPGVEIDEPEGRDLCFLLTADDFSSAGIDGAGQPERGTDPYGSSFCVYSGKSGAMGGIEFDAFPSEDEGAAEDTFATAVGEGPAGKPPAGATFDEAAFAVDGEVAYLTARQGRLVISITAPVGPDIEQALVNLAVVAFDRSSDLQ